MKTEIETTTQHTPGPWEYARTDQFDESLDVFESKTARTLFRSINTLPKKEAEANARLIAVAPELLDACEGLFEVIEARVRGAELSNVKELLYAGRAAISKAKGQP